MCFRDTHGLLADSDKHLETLAECVEHLRSAVRNFSLFLNETRIAASQVKD